MRGALDRIRTYDILLRRQTLYPLSYEGGTRTDLEPVLAADASSTSTETTTAACAVRTRGGQAGQPRNGERYSSR